MRSITKLGEGWDNFAYDIDDEVIVRIGKRPDPAVTRGEVDLLAAVAAVAELPTPRVLFSDPAAGLIVYGKLPGVPLHACPVPQDLPRTLGRFLTGLHRAEISAPPLDDSMDDILGDAREEYQECAAVLPAEARRSIEDFLAQAPPAPPPVTTFCHNDLGDEHILLDGDQVSGVIDWSDAAIADPARDLALLYRDLGPDFYRRTLAHYERERDPAWDERIRFYARCAIIGDIAYGLRTGETHYSDEGLSRLARTMA